MEAARWELAADFHRFYGLSLSTIRDSGIPLQEVAAMAVHLPEGSATHRAINPAWRATPELEVLRAAEHGIRVLAWMRTEKAKKGLGYPRPIRFPWDPAPEGSLVGDSMTLDEAAAWLGWDKKDQEA